MGDILGGQIISQTGAVSGSIDRLRYRTDKAMQPEDECPSRALLLPIISRADRGDATPGAGGENVQVDGQRALSGQSTTKIAGRTPMLTRCSMMLASIAAGVIMHDSTASAKAAQPSTPVNFDVPAGACDCHTHIHPDPEKFPFFSGRVYTPELASPEEMTALHKALHMERVVIVTPSIYGPDNSATLFGMAARGPTARGVAVIDDRTSESDLDAMQQAGFRGIRLNLATSRASLTSWNSSNPARPM